jgi:competence protein ComEA
MRRKRKTSETESYEEKKSVGASLKISAVAVTFLVIGYQAALFVNSSAVAQLIANRDAPDTVYVTDEALARRILAADASNIEASEPPRPADSELPMASGGPEEPSPSDKPAAAGVQLDGLQTGRTNGSGSGSVTVRRDAEHSEAADRVYLKQRERKVESFPFDPNSVSITDLQRLGFSEKQALSIDAYRKKGGRFRRPSDFAKSYVVSDSVFARLEPYIRIPKLDINAADSAAFDALPGIGGHFASKMVEYREKLHGYSYPEQLMDIRNFDEERFSGLADLITVGPSEPYALWTLSEEQLAEHPYIGSRAAAHGIVLFRENHRAEGLTPEALGAAGVLDALNASRLARCRIAPPEP